MTDHLPLVTICCITYNHEPYIRECLEGFVMQQTDFKFEAIVHDDASTDDTAAIIAEFAEKYPDIIKPLYETENQYSKRDGSIRRIMNAHMRGKYIAMCEGDDYWTDPLKLQKQVDFLEANPDFSMCFHCTKIDSNDNRDVTHYLFLETLEQREYKPAEVISKWSIPTASILYRTEVIYNRPEHKDFCVGDIILTTTCCRHGRIYCMSDIMSGYRLHTGGVSNDLTNVSQLKLKSAMLECFPEFKDEIALSLINPAIPIIKDNLRHAKLKTATMYFIKIGSIVGFSRLLKHLLYWTIGYKLVKKESNL